jgi:NADH dehydrogenase
MVEGKGNHKQAGAHAVTGAFSYTGKYIARRLLGLGNRVRTLTGHARPPNGFAGQIEVRPLDFSKPAELAESLRGATTLYNTYWVRFERSGVTYAKAVENTRILLRAAGEAGVRRVVHLSVTNPSADSPLPYFRGKAQVEEAVINSGLSYAILRPTLVFGKEDILVNNIAWLLRRLPVFAIPGKGDYRLQPVYVDDVADQAVHAARLSENVVTDVVGPEVYSFREFLELIAEAVGSRARLVSVRPRLAHLLTKPVSRCMRDVLLTREDMQGLMLNLLTSASPPACSARFSEWVRKNADNLGSLYSSELDRHFR